MSANTYGFGKPKLTVKDRDEISYLRFEGVPTKEICKQFGISTQSMYAYAPRERP